MRDPEAAARDYVETAGFTRPAPAPTPPDLVAMPLRHRLDLTGRGEVDAAAWRDEADSWSLQADARYRACVDLRPLPPSRLPVAVGIKDTVDVAGLPTRLGLRRHRHHPRRSATVIHRLDPASINAKVVATELNIGIGSGCLNPYTPHIDPAGSSTGSAVAVAAGICDLSLGTDVLGSVRWPAGRCGVVGLRTTHDEGALSGIFPLSPAMDAVGWVARTADDLALLWNALALGPGVVSSERTTPYRIGIAHEVLDGDVEQEILDAQATAGAALGAAGHGVRAVSLADPWQWRGAAWELCAHDAWAGARALPERILDDLAASTRRALEAGSTVDADRLTYIQTAMAAHRAAVPQLFRDHGVDAWLLPLDSKVPRPRTPQATPSSSIPIPGDPGYDSDVGYTPVASFAGLPAITFPVGRSRANEAPLAMQLVGCPWAEAVLIRLARDVATQVGDLEFLLR